VVPPKFTRPLPRRGSVFTYQVPAALNPGNGWNRPVLLGRTVGAVSSGSSGAMFGLLAAPAFTFSGSL